MNGFFLWSALFCTVLGLAACGSGSNLAHKPDKLPGKAGGNPSEEWDGQFRAVLERYLDTFCFEYPMEGRFAQCGSVVLKPAE